MTTWGAPPADDNDGWRLTFDGARHEAVVWFQGQPIVMICSTSVPLDPERTPEPADYIPPPGFVDLYSWDDDEDGTWTGNRGRWLADGTYEYHPLHHTRIHSRET